MAKNEHAAQNKGQQKTHKVVDTSGVESSITQEEWRNRDKSAGLKRVDEVEDAPDTETETPDVPDAGTTDSPATDTPGDQTPA